MPTPSENKEEEKEEQEEEGPEVRDEVSLIEKVREPAMDLLAPMRLGDSNSSVLLAQKLVILAMKLLND